LNYERTYDELSIEDAKRISPKLSEVLGEHAIACSAPITLEQRSDVGGAVNNGSCAFIRTQSRTFGVSAAHVIQAALELVESGNGRILVGQSQVQNFGECILDIDDNLDLATFRVPEDALPYIRSRPGWECRFAEGWPPVIPEKEENIFLAGWPGQLRDSDDTSFTFRTFVMSARVNSLNPKRISLLREKEFEDEGPNAAPEGFDMGGISGGPMFSMVRVNGLIQLRFCGVIVEASSDWGLLQGCRADFLTDDGMITR
jgi:hypothetical protein